MSLHDCLVRLSYQDDDATAGAVAAQLNADQVIRRLSGGDALWSASSVRRVARALADHAGAMEPKAPATAARVVGQEAIALALNAAVDPPSSEQPSDQP